MADVVAGRPVAGSEQPRWAGWWTTVLTLAGRYRLVLAYLVMVAVFSVTTPGDFFAVATFRTILTVGAVLAVIALALTIVLMAGQFDLSVGSLASLAGTAAVLLMRDQGVPTVVAVLAAVAVGAAMGGLSGLIVAYGKVAAFVATLAVGSVALGVENALTGNATIPQGINESYKELSRGTFLGMPLTVFVSLLVLAVAWFAMDVTVLGRRIRAVGANEEAARLAGVRTARVKLLSFVVFGAFGGVAGVIITAEAGASVPNSGAPYLLPAYAAAFLGLSATRRGHFHPVATYFGVVFMQTLATGLLMLRFPSWSTAVLQGVVLAVAILVARRR